MAGVIDIFIVYKFIKQLSTPWEEWEAFELGLIDKDGKTIRKSKTSEEKEKYPRWQVMVHGIKRLLDKLPFGKTKLGSFAAALFLLKEEMGLEEIQLLEDAFQLYFEENVLLIESENSEKINMVEKGRYKFNDNDKILFLKEDTPAFITVLGEPLFNLTDKLTEQKFIVSAESLERF